MPSSTPLFRDLLSEGWFVSVVGTDEDRVSVQCLMFSRDYDEETGYTDIVFGDTEVASGSLHCVANYMGTFELRSHGPAALLNTLPSSWGFKQMPEDMVNAIGALITPENFPEAAECMCLMEDAYPEEEDARTAFWVSVNQQIEALRTEGDSWGALKLHREAVNKLINWVDPPPSPSRSIPEPNLDDMTPPARSLVEEVYADSEDEDDEPDDYLPLGSHLLPEDFQSFLRSWNQTITASTGHWLGEPRKVYKQQNPDQWNKFSLELKRLSILYAADVAAVKAYQRAEEA
jgi:hypothetical protein